MIKGYSENTEDEAIRLYMKRITSTPLLSYNEEVALAGEITRGNEEARKKLIISNLRLVVKIAHDFKGRGLPLLDLISEGNIGLMRATKKYDPKRGATFASYASYWINQAMGRAIEEKSRIIRVPYLPKEMIKKIRSSRERLKCDLGREPEDYEIALIPGISKQAISAYRMSSNGCVRSLNEQAYGEEDSLLEELVGEDGQEAKDCELKKYLLDCIKKLGDKEQRVLIAYFGLNGENPKVLREIATEFGLTRQRIDMIKDAALGKLRGIVEFS